MSYSHSEIVSRFVDGKTKGAGANMYIDGNIIYSYGSHFPLMVKSNERFILNADKYSVSTSQHQSICFSSADYMIPFSALQNILNIHRPNFPL